MVEEALLILKNEGAIGWDGGLYESCRPGVSVCVCVCWVDATSERSRRNPASVGDAAVDRSVAASFAVS